jgi:hypothetical protein
VKKTKKAKKSTKKAKKDPAKTDAAPTKAADAPKAAEAPRLHGNEEGEPKKEAPKK